MFCGKKVKNVKFHEIDVKFNIYHKMIQHFNTFLTTRLTVSISSKFSTNDCRSRRHVQRFGRRFAGRIRRYQ